MLPISSNAIIEKNKVTSDGTWLLLLEITYEDETPVYVCLNNTSVTWNSNTYLPAIFNLSGITETKDAEVPSIPLTIFDLNRTFTPIIEDNDGGIGAEVVIRVVHSAYLDNTTPEFEETTEIIDCVIDDSARIQFKLGAENLQDRRCPQQRYLKNNCRFIFKRAELEFISGGTVEIESGHYIQGFSSSSTAKVVEVRLTSGSWAAGDAVGKIIINTIDGAFQGEIISLYTDLEFTNRIALNACIAVGTSSGKCGYTGSETECNRSFARCEELNNKTRFGAFPSVGSTGFLA